MVSVQEQHQVKGHAEKTTIANFSRIEMISKEKINYEWFTIANNGLDISWDSEQTNKSRDEMKQQKTESVINEQ